MNPDDISIVAAPYEGKLKRAIEASYNGKRHRDLVNIDSAAERQRLAKKISERFDIADSEVDSLDNKIIEAADRADEIPDSEADVGVAGDNEKESQATRLVKIAEQAELFHNPDGDAFAVAIVKGHNEVWPIRSKHLKRWLARQFFDEYCTTPNSQAIHDALQVLEGDAIFNGPERTVFTRLAEYEERVYLDLANDNWQAVEIDGKGWRVIDKPPVMFRRAKAMLPLPNPEPGDDFGLLRYYVNVSDDDWPLVVAWLVAAARPTGPYPVLVLHGEQGSAKSTLVRFLRGVIDPNTSPLRSSPREPRDLMIAAQNGWVVTLDNMSRIQPWLSDALCRLATGGGFSTRQLYTDDDEMIFHAQRPVILNGIEELCNRSDLLDRSLIVYLPTISENDRMVESDLNEEYEGMKPQILGALLDAISMGLRNLKTTKLERLPRMADFARFVVACEPALPWSPGTFIAAYAGNRESANELALDSSPIGKVFIDWASGLGIGDDGDADDDEFHTLIWEGTATELLNELNNNTDDKTLNLKSWPKTASTLSNELRRLAPNLRAFGFDVELGQRTGRRRSITIRLSS